MPQRASKSTKSWATLLSEAVRNNETRPSGDGWMTFDEIRKELKISHMRTYALINSQLDSGKAEVFEGQRLSPSNRLVRAVWYRLS